MKCLFGALAVFVSIMAGCTRPLGGLSSPANPAPDLQPHTTATLTLVDRIGGPSMAVAVDGRYAYLGQHAEFSVLDLATGAHPVRVAYLPLSTNAIALEAGFAYVAGKAGLTVVDIRRPDQPVVSGFAQSAAAFADVAIVGEIAFAVGPAAGVEIIDITDARAPQIVGRLDLPAVEAVAAAGHYVYLATADGLRILDASDARQPILAGSATQMRWVQAVAIAGDYAFITGSEGELAIVDVADPAHPAQIGSIKVPGYLGDVRVADGFAYVATGSGGVYAINVANPRLPAIASLIELEGTPLNIAIAGRRLYATDLTEGGLHIVDVADASRPHEIGRYRAPGMTAAVAVSGADAFVIAGAHGDLHLLELGGPAGLGASRQLPNGGESWALAAYGERIYQPAGGLGLQLIDVSNPLQPVPLSTVAISGYARQVVVTDAAAYVIDAGGGLHVVDLTSPIPREAAVFEVAGGALAMAVAGRYAFVGAGEGRILVLDLAEPLAPKVAGGVGVPGDPLAAALVDTYLVIAIRGQGLQLFDIAAPASPRLLSTLALAGDSYQLVVQDTRLVVAAGTGGVHVIDIDDPAAPVETAAYDTPDDARGVAVAGDRVLVADHFGGLLVLAYAPAQQLASERLAR